MQEQADYDSPWKEMIEGYFLEFMTFFFPEIAADIDWDLGYEFLDKELQQVARDAEMGRRIADKLVKVRRNGSRSDLWVFIHIEVQGTHEIAFEERMYVYNYRLFDCYHQPICSLAVLADERQSWKPTRFQYDIWGCQAGLTFPVVKLIEYHAQDLETHPNMFALATLAYLKTLDTKKQPEQRYEWKFRLYRVLYDRGYERQDILELMRFIDWVMVLPDELQFRFDETITAYEEEQHMQYITSFERIGMEKGRREGIQQGVQQGLQQGLERGQLEQSRLAVIDVLTVRFQVVPISLVNQILRCEELVLLQALLRQAAIIPSLAEFEATLREAVAAQNPQRGIEK
ncbi:hypothetical protein U14_00569 [Candidatus Moduliflexus flocculans]|uniref:Transposase n=1 Tax=Candidatus Moduliflexus flocculans TaxID=1499966 RepID=A0A0S6VVN8_9BACT|nr:hypothetical protein U14_00569 [Candidatus Moduliflexus flocculans]